MNTYFYDVYKFGAKGDGQVKDTEAIQSAIDRCNRDGGGVVVCPPGTFLTEPLYLRSNVNLHLMAGATILGSDKPADYKNWESKRSHTEFAPYNSKYLIISENENNIALTGQGTINGQGLVYYDRSGKENVFWNVISRDERPLRMIMFVRCTNVLVEGLTFRDPSAWTFWVIGCNGVVFDKIKIFAEYRCINTDGIDIDCCSNVSVSNSFFHTGDDCIVLRAQDRVLGERIACENIAVTNCIMESNCNAIRVSYVGDGVIRNAVISNSIIRNSRRGIVMHIPSLSCTPKRDRKYIIKDIKQPIVENLLFSNMIVEANQPVFLYLDEDSVAESLRNIMFSNMHIEGISASVICGNKTVPIKNVGFHNIRMILKNGDLMPTDFPVQALYCREVHDLEFDSLKICGSHLSKPNRPAVICERVDTLKVNSFYNETGGPDIERINTADLNKTPWEETYTDEASKTS